MAFVGFFLSRYLAASAYPGRHFKHRLVELAGSHLKQRPSRWTCSTRLTSRFSVTVIIEKPAETLTSANAADTLFSRWSTLDQRVL
jgi:hypothetical protein